ncbi:ABC-2 type transport system permease protein/bacitracin transport system permease protein [Anaerovirgula multivorans]|uniref:ABC-2 type transport system permease protein/bacitracin transport system permease protein n=1 Tax=Anaerovirgula multivorans TaxID=312168 RepID=A0A239I4H4_9FIRM|nr:ABC transporter permease [Anaerovirgula multivorans]SNS87973.1 ABC-2 type transport system permease protein/bacitracin transport system permease protein [Anaerovirgula multivorans]
MLSIIKTEFEKLKRLHILLIGLIGMAFPAILSVFTQAVVTEEGKVQNFDFAALFNSSIWNSVTIFMPVIFTLIGGYLINREYTDNTLKSILPVPVTFRRLLFGKLLAIGLLSVVFGFYCYIITVLVGYLSGVPDLSVAVLVKSLWQMVGIAACTYIAVLPIIAFTSKRPGAFMGGVIVSFITGYSGMFIKNVVGRSLYPILAGFTVIGFDTKTFMNTNEPANLMLSSLSLVVMLLLTIMIVMLTNLPQATSKNQKHKKSNIFLRPGQRSR